MKNQYLSFQLTTTVFFSFFPSRFIKQRLKWKEVNYMRYTPLLTSPSQSRLIDKFIALDMKCYKENFVFVGAFNDVMSSAFGEPEK